MNTQKLLKYKFFYRLQIKYTPPKERRTFFFFFFESLTPSLTLFLSANKVKNPFWCLRVEFLVPWLFVGYNYLYQHVFLYCCRLCLFVLWLESWGLLANPFTIIQDLSGILIPQLSITRKWFQLLHLLIHHLVTRLVLSAMKVVFPNPKVLSPRYMIQLSGTYFFSSFSFFLNHYEEFANIMCMNWHYSLSLSLWTEIWLSYGFRRISACPFRHRRVQQAKGRNS